MIQMVCDNCMVRAPCGDPLRKPGETGIRTVLPPPGWIEVHTDTASLDACSPRCETTLVAQLKKGSR